MQVGYVHDYGFLKRMYKIIRKGSREGYSG